MMVIDRENRIVLANHLAASLLGWPTDELESLRLEALIPKRLREDHARHVARFFDAPEVRPTDAELDLWACRRDGSEIPVHISLRSWVVKGSKYVIAGIRDVSRKHRAEEELRESEERFRIAAEIATDIIWTFNVEQDLCLPHGDVDGLMHLPQGQFPRTFTGWFELIHPEDIDRIRKEMGHVVETGAEEWRFEYRILDGDNSYRHWVDCGTTTGWLEDGRGNLAVGVTRDVTDQVEVREALERKVEELRQSEERFRIAAECAGEIIWSYDYGGDLAIPYGDVDTLMHYPQGGFPRKISEWYEIIHPEDVDRIRMEVERVIESGCEEWMLEYRVLAGDGSYHHWRDRGRFTSWTEDGKGNAGVSVTMDFTDEVKAREELELLRDRLAAENIYLRDEIRANQEFEQVVGESDAWRRVLQQVKLVAGSDSTVLLSGETGTGKEVVARALHSAGDRADRPLIKVNCGALPTTLIESELFGHEKGAFTGADAARDGRFELADQGTLFLDEIGELSLELQAKLLRVLEDGEFERLGSSKTRRVDVRVIAATNRNLEAAVRDGHFRSDLFYRLAVFPIELPPLRDRRDDIPLLATYFLGRFNARQGTSIDSIPTSTMELMETYDWPGNVRELENVIERGVIVTSGKTLSIDPAVLRSPRDRRATDRRKRGSSPTMSGAPDVWADAGGTLEDMERAHIVAVLETCDWTVKGRGNAAERLGLKESTLRSRMKRLGIERPPGATSPEEPPGSYPKT